MTSLVHFGCLIFMALCSLCEADLPKETYMTVPQKIAFHGYPVQKHKVVTSDGYVIQVHRIPPRGQRAKARGGKTRAVLLMHGMGGSSDNYVVMGPNRSLSYILADAGYDVWMGNFRGNQYTSHQTLTRSDLQFWKYSFHEHGQKDLPAIIDHVLRTTGLQKLMYVGHSMGTTSFLIMLALRPEYNDKVVSFIAFTPAVYVESWKPIAKEAYDRRVMDGLRAAGVPFLGILPPMMDLLINNICTAREANEDVCMTVMYGVAGENYDQHDWNMTPCLLASIQPVSLNQIEHYAKLAYSGVFTTLEGGFWGPVIPYNLSNVKVPSLLIYGENDQLTRKEGVARLAKELKAVGALEGMVPACDCPKFNHLDFAIAKDVGTLLHRPLVKVIKRLYEKYYPQ